MISYRKRRQSVLIPTMMLMLLTLIWGLTFPATKSALKDTDPMHFLMLRFGMATFLMTLWLGVHSGKGVKLFMRGTSSSSRRNTPFHMPKWVWRYGMVGVFLFLGFALQTSGMRWTTASRSGFFTGLLVVFTPVIATMLKTSRSGLMTWIGVPVSLLGVWFLADPKIGGLNRGDVLTLICAVAFAVQMVALEWASKPERNRKSESPDGAILPTYVQIIIVAFLAGVWSMVEGKSINISTAGWVALGYNTLFGTIIATFLQTRWQPAVPAGHAALVFGLEPLFAATFATLILGDIWTIRTVIGAVLVLAAMMISSVGMTRKSR